MFVLGLSTLEVEAHGGVSVEDDLCIMRIGTMRAHFTGYQPKVRASQEFCEDIPELGEAIIVLDFLSPALRKMTISFQVIKDESNKGANTTLADIDGVLQNPSSLLINKEATQYASGSFNVSLMINEPGWYVGVLTALDPDNKEKYVSVFPFSVGKRDYSRIILWCAAIVFLGFSFYFLSRGNRRPEQLGGE